MSDQWKLIKKISKLIAEEIQEDDYDITITIHNGKVKCTRPDYPFQSEKVIWEI
jgi:hypothetical protein